MPDTDHTPSVDALTDEPQIEAMQPPMDDAAGGPDVDEKTHAVQQDIAETPPAG